MAFNKVEEMRVNRGIAERSAAFIRRELEMIPTWHPQHRAYREKLAEVEKMLGKAVGRS